MLSDLNEKDVSIEKIAEKALTDTKLLAELLAGITSRKETYRYNCFKVLRLISEEHPEALYPEWDLFADLLESDNAYHKYITIYLITNLVRIDRENKFEKIFDKYYRILDGEGTVASAHLAANSGKIARAKPHLQTQITGRLLNIDKIHRGKQKDLIKGHAIEAFDEYFDEAESE